MKTTIIYRMAAAGTLAIIILTATLAGQDASKPASDSPLIIEMQTKSVGSSVTPFAVIPVRARVLFVSEAIVKIGVVRLQKAATRPSTQPASQPAPLPVPLPVPLTNIKKACDWGQMKIIESASDGKNSCAGEDAVDLSTLKYLPEPGDVVAVVVEAQDDKGGRRSAAAVVLKIVSPQDMQVELTRRQQRVALEFGQAAAFQDVCQVKLKEASAALTGAAPDLAKCQKCMSESLVYQNETAKHVLKTADQMQAIWEEMTYNRVFGENEHSHLKNDIITPLRDASKSIEAAGIRLVGNSQPSQGKVDTARLQNAITTGMADQAPIHEQVTQLARSMDELTRRCDLINQVMTLQDMWRKAGPGTTRVRKLEAEQLPGATNPATAPAANSGKGD